MNAQAKKKEFDKREYKDWLASPEVLFVATSKVWCDSGKASFFLLTQEIYEIGGVCGQVVNTSNSRSGGPGFKPHLLRCFFRQGTLLPFVSLHPGV